MASNSPNMALVRWDSGSDPYDHNQLVANWNKVDLHDHSSTKGVQIGSAGIANGAVTNIKIATGIDGAKITAASIPGSALAVGAVPGNFIFYEEKTWSVPGEIRAPTGTPTQDYLPPFYQPLYSTTHTASLVGVYHRLEQGSVSASVYKKTWGGSESTVSGFTGIGVTTTDTELLPTAVALTHRDRIRVQLSSPSGTPWNLSFTVVIRHTVVGA